MFTRTVFSICFVFLATEAIALELTSTTYQAVDLGCAEPNSSQYTLDVRQEIAAVKAGESYVRSVTVNAAGNRRGSYRFDCEVDYEGEYQIRGGRVYGGLERVACDCGEVTGDNAEAICRIGDLFAAEAPGVEVDIEQTADGFRAQQLGTPPRAIRGCGMRYPWIEYQR